MRLTSTGQLKPCLYSQSTLDLRQLLRSSAPVMGIYDKSPAYFDSIITELLKKAIFYKPLGHHFEEKPANFNMNEIGG